MNKIYNEIYYVSDLEIYGVYDVWQFPEDTVERGSGDCEDVSILLAESIMKKTKLPAGIATGDGKVVTHAWVYFKNLYYDATRNKIIKPEVYEKEFRNIVFMTYEQALHRCSEDRILYPF